MKKDKETRQKLLESARAEFLEKGYMKASLRTICKNAGLTTGALYFFFKDKEDLFLSLTKDTVDGIYQIMQSHFQGESNMLQDGSLYQQVSPEDSNDLADSIMIIHQMYQRREDIIMVLTKSQGSSLENITDRFIETAEAHYRAMAKGMQEAYPDKVLDDKFIHWLAHEQINAFIYMITHIENEEEGIRYISQAVTYMMAGWYGLFLK